MPAPDVITSSATDITPSKAVLNGTVDPNGLATDYWFERFRDDWEAAGDAFRENRCTQPSFEASTANTVTTVPSGGTLDDYSRSEAWAVDGKFSAHLKITAGENQGNAGVFFPTSVVSSASYAVSAGEDIAVSVVLNVVTVPSVAQEVAVFWYTAANGFISGSAVGTVAGTGEQTLSAVVTAPGTAAKAIVMVGHNITLPMSNRLPAEETTEFYIDAVLFEGASSVDPYFPRPHQLESGQAVWTGTEHASSSKLATPVDLPATKDGDAGEGEVAVEVPETAEGLSGGKEYHFRLYAENADGEAFGADVTFTTVAGATAPPASATASAPAPSVLEVVVVAVTASATASVPSPTPEIAVTAIATATASSPTTEVAVGSMPSTTENYKGLPLPHPNILANPARLGPSRFTALERRALGVD